MVLKDPAAVMYLPQARPQIKYLWVEDFNESMAHQYFNQRNAFLEDESEKGQENLTIRNKIFTAIGTRVLELEAVIEVGD